MPTPKNCTELEGPLIMVGFISHPLMCVCVTSEFKLVATFCSPDPISIMSHYSAQMWYFEEETDDQNPFYLSYGIELES